MIESWATISDRHLTLYYKSKLEPWNYTVKPPKSGKDRSAMHRQFSLDRAAAAVGFAWTNNTDGSNDFVKITVSEDFKWRFQKFEKRKAKKAPEVGYNVIPKDKHKEAIVEAFKTKVVGLDSKLYNLNFGSATSFRIAAHLELADLTAMLKTVIGLEFAEQLDLALEEFE